MFQDMFIDIFKDGWKGVVIGILFWVASIVIVGLIFLGIIYLVDSSFLPIHEDEGEIVSLDFTPAHTETILIYNAATKMSIPHTASYPDSWSVTVALKFGSGSISVNQDFYNSSKCGDRVRVGYVYGRISNLIYIKEIYN